MIPKAVLKIAIVSPIEWRTPPRQSGWRELNASVLTEGLVALGHQVTLFATADSITRAQLCATCPRPFGEDKSLDPASWNILHLSEAFGRADEFDIIHLHGDFAGLACVDTIDTPIVFTFYETPTPRQLPLFHKFMKKVSFVAVSQSGKIPGISHVPTIYPGVALDEYRLGFGEKYLLFFGSIASGRGLEEIINFAEQTPFPLVFGGVIEDQTYYKSVIEPLAAEKKLLYLGPIGPNQRNEVFGNAIALLHLSEKEQAFRYSLIEAMACGTPVIAKNTPANREIIQPNLNGFLVNNSEETIEAIMAVGQISRRKVRQRVLDHFSQANMVAQYVRLYRDRLEHPGTHPDFPHLPDPTGRNSPDLPA